jgi:hypothetical protein
MITVSEFVQRQRGGTRFFLTAGNLQATDNQFHDEVAPYVAAGGGDGFSITRADRDSMGPGLYTVVICERAAR